MPAPTRPQIEAAVALPTYKIEIDEGAGYVTVSGAEIRAINTKLVTTNDQDNAFAFGTVATSLSSVEIADTTTITAWQLARLRISYGFDTSTYVVAFEGVITKRQHQGHFYTYEASGFDFLIARKKIYTEVFYRRPIATETTATSVEDISDGSYKAGLLNNIMWRSGGRPYEQPSYGSDPLFKFWYSFDQSIVAPRWSWISGENAWEEVFRLVRAAGGQLYQDRDGVIYYKQPLTFGYVASGTTLYDFGEDTFQSISEDSSTVSNLDTIQASFVERILQPMQQVYESTTPKLLPDAETTDIDIEMQYPVYAYAENVNSFDFIIEAVKATYFDGRDATLDYVDFTITFNTTAAQLLALSFNNSTGEPISLNRILVNGRPITAGSEGKATYSTGDGPELQLEDNVYIQSFAQAYRLVRMFYDFYHTNRAIITLDGVGYDPDRYLGEVVTITYSAWGLSAARHRIIGLDYNNGSKMSVTLAPISGLPTRDDVFIVNGTYADATVKKVSY